MREGSAQPPKQDSRRRVLDCVGTERGAELPHQRSGVDSAADDVAHDEPDAAVAVEDGVVPVAADLSARASRQIPRRELHPWDLRKATGQEPALQRLRYVTGLVVKAGSVDRERHPLAGELEEPEVVVSEAVPRGACTNLEDPEQRFVDRQWYCRRAGEVASIDQRPEHCVMRWVRAN